MVCDRAWMKALIGSVYGVGWLFGAPVAGYLADRYYLHKNT